MMVWDTLKCFGEEHKIDNFKIMYCFPIVVLSDSVVIFNFSIRLEEGFRFAHSGSGIIYMVQEFPVQVSIDIFLCCNR